MSGAPMWERQEVIAEAAEKRGDQHEEHHQHAVIGDEAVVAVTVRRAVPLRPESQPFLTDELHAGMHQLDPHEDRQGDGDDPDQRGSAEVEDADVLVVGGHEPAFHRPASVGLRHGRWASVIGFLRSLAKERGWGVGVPCRARGRVRASARAPVRDAVEGAVVHSQRPFSLDRVMKLMTSLSG